MGPSEPAGGYELKLVFSRIKINHTQICYKGSHMSSEEYCYTQMADTTISSKYNNRSLAPNMLCMLLVIQHNYSY